LYQRCASYAERRKTATKTRCYDHVEYTGTTAAYDRYPAPPRRGLIVLTGLLTTTAHAQDPSPLARIEALGLDTVELGRVTAYFASTDRENAERLATLSEMAAAYFERELGASFPSSCCPHPEGLVRTIPRRRPWAIRHAMGLGGRFANDRSRFPG
jgi:hypothetical protein